jgi:hypothetical protein
MNLCSREPTVRDVLSDPLIRTLMKADRVDPSHLETMLDGIARTVASRSDGHKAKGSLCCF